MNPPDRHLPQPQQQAQDEFPWELVAAFLELGDSLSLLSTCRGVLARLHDGGGTGTGVGTDACVSWLSSVLRDRNVYVVPPRSGAGGDGGGGSFRWTEATRGSGDEKDDNGNNTLKLCLQKRRRRIDDIGGAGDAQRREVLRNRDEERNNAYGGGGGGGRSDDAPGLDELLRFMRVLKYLPKCVAVCYNGKYGRHCQVVDVTTTYRRHRIPTRDSPYFTTYALAEPLPRCRRGKKNGCPTCQMRIPSVENTASGSSGGIGTDDDGDDDVREENASDDDDELEHNAAEDENGGDDGEEEASRTSDLEVGPNIDDYFRIELAGGERRLVLDTYYASCVPNLPSHLVCPRCRVRDRRTLLLSEFSYRSEPGTDRADPRVAPLTFTPAELLEDDDLDSEADDNEEDGAEIEHGGSPARCRKRKREAASSPSEPFPPRQYFDAFIPREEDPAEPEEFIPPPPSDCKWAVSIHCVSCRDFGVIAPARLERLPTYGPGAGVRLGNSDGVASAPVVLRR